MKVIRHGFSVGIERIEAHFYLSLKAVGKLTHEDYETITPLIDSALEKVGDPVVNIYFDASEFEGWEARAAWDDFKLGLQYGKEIRKIAIFSPVFIFFSFRSCAMQLKKTFNKTKNL